MITGNDSYHLNRSWIVESTNTSQSNPKAASNSSSSAQTTAMASAGVGAGIALIMSSLNMSSIAVLWSIFSQFRLLIFLILSDAYLPQSVIDYISGMKLFSFNFSFLSFQTLPVIKVPLQLLDFTQNSVELETIGLNSGSSFVNSINLLLTVIMVIFLHIM